MQHNVLHHLCMQHHNDMQAFAWLESHKMQSGPLRDYTEQAEYYYQKSLYQDSVQSLTRALHAKQQVSTTYKESA